MSARVFHIYIRELSENVFSVSTDVDGKGVEALFKPPRELQDGILALHDRDLGHRFVDIRAQDAVCEQIGTTLFTRFIVGEVEHEYYAYRSILDSSPDTNSRLPRIALHLPRSLQYIPWEVLKDPNDDFGQFLSLRGSIVRYDAATETRSKPIGVETADVNETPVFIVVVSNPTNQSIYNFAIEKKYKKAKFIQVTPAEFDRFREELIARNPLGIIFFGHGEVDEREGYLIFVKRVKSRFVSRLEEDRRSAHAIGKEVGAGRPPRLAYILACESALVENAVDFDRTVTGTLVTTTSTGAVIGVQEKIDQKALMKLLETCIGELADAIPLDLSLRRARLDILAIDPEEGDGKFARHDWWIPTLYARTQNFDIIRGRARDARKQLPSIDRASSLAANPGTRWQEAIVPTVERLAAHAWQVVCVPREPQQL
jgi:hypothetical protein